MKLVILFLPCRFYKWDNTQGSGPYTAEQKVVMHAQTLFHAGYVFGVQVHN